VADLLAIVAAGGVLALALVRGPAPTGLGPSWQAPPQGGAAGVCSTGCAWFPRHTPRPRAFHPGPRGAASLGACPQQTRPPRSHPNPLWEGRSTARALNPEWANAAPDRYVEVTTSLAAPLVTTGSHPARGHRSVGRSSSAARPVGRPPQLEAALEGGSALDLRSAPWPG
jgi:hypothetical protein